MHSFFNLAALLAAASFATAQTWTDCDPLKTTCPDDPALAGTYSYSYGGAAPDFKTTAGTDVILYEDSSCIFRVEKKLDAPTIASNFYIMFGHLEVVMKAANGGGIVSSVILQSDDLDEVDWEWVGSKMGEAQSNYFGKGNTDSYDRGAVHAIDATQFHNYALDWTPEKLDWIIDGVVVRSLRPADVTGDFYPQTPMQIRLGSWAAGDADNEPGTVAWAGGPINYSAGPFDMVVKSIKVVDYSSGSAYRYTDKTGSWQSIQAVGGKVMAGAQKGKGNAGKLAVSTPAAGSSDTTGPHKVGLIIPTTSGAFDGELSKGKNFNKGADSSESDQSPTSSGSSLSGSGSADSGKYGSASTGELTGAGSKLFAFEGIVFGAMVLVIGWIL